ncbi:MAG: hypothetical protein NXI21_11890 [Alphaproteobacteria bacterium]|nr:hypothetical protein [Alphaproteobacteria bacterium]
MFFKRENAMEFVKAGTRFRRTRSDRMVETARVLSIASDDFGIPHVRYELSVEKPVTRQTVIEGPRVLALATFTSTYCERVAN